MSATQTTSRTRLSVWHYWGGLIKAHPGVYTATAFLRITIFGIMFQIAGLLQREYFNSLTGDALLGWEPWTWAALVVAFAVARGSMIMTDMYFYFRWTFSSGAVMRKNMFEHILNRPGRGRYPVPRARPSAVSAAMPMRWAISLPGFFSLSGRGCSPFLP